MPTDSRVPAAAARDDVRNVMLSPHRRPRSPDALIDTAPPRRTTARAAANGYAPAYVVGEIRGADRRRRASRENRASARYLARRDAGASTVRAWRSVSRAARPTTHPLAAEAHPRTGAGRCDARRRRVALAGALMHTFLDLAAPGDTRMRQPAGRRIPSGRCCGICGRGWIFR